MSDPVLDLLAAQNIPFTVSGRDYVTKCLNPDHMDASPSFRIDKVTGICHCFSCGFKINLFKYFGITGNFTSIKVAKLKEKLRALSASTLGVEAPRGFTPFNRAFRGISTETMQHFGAGTTSMVSELENRVMLPITDVRGKTSVYVCRHAHSNAQPRYVNYPVQAKVNMFPLVMKERYTDLVIVEGIFDMLNLYDKGLQNVACTFGTQLLKNDTAAKLLPYKTQGINTIYIIYDGDTAGSDSAKELKPLIEEAGFLVEIITLEDGTDPGEMSQEDVDLTREYINEKSRRN
jgi:DNA primase